MKKIMTLSEQTAKLERENQQLRYLVLDAYESIYMLDGNETPPMIAARNYWLERAHALGIMVKRPNISKEPASKSETGLMGASQ